MNRHLLVEALATKNAGILCSLVESLATRTQTSTNDLSLELYLILTAVDRHLTCGVEVALSVSIDFYIKNNDGDTALHHAARANHTAVMKVLIEYDGGKNINGQNDRGFTALHSAVHFSNLDAVRMLISAGAEIVNVLDTENHAPLHYATSKEIKSFLQRHINWKNRKNFLLFLTHYSFLPPNTSDGDNKAEDGELLPSNAYIYHSCSSNAIHRLFDIADLDRNICTFL